MYIADKKRKQKWQEALKAKKQTNSPMQDIPDDPMDSDEAMDKPLPQGLSGDGPAATVGYGPNGGPPAPQDTAKDQKDMPPSFLKLTQKSITSHRRATRTYKTEMFFSDSWQGS